MKMKLRVVFYALLFISFLSSQRCFGESATITEPLTASGNCGWNEEDDRTWSFENGTLTISGGGEMGPFWYGIHAWNYDVTQDPWYHLRELVHDIVIGDGVQNIQDYAFADMFNLETVKVAATVKTIGEGAFENCISLKNMELPWIEAIGSNAFSGCSNLETVLLGESFINTGNRAFFNCTSLKEITIPDSVIEKEPFTYCNRVESIYIGNRFEVECWGVDWDTDLLSALSRDYYNGGKLLEDLEGKKLREIRVGSENRYFKSVDGVLFDRTGEVLIRYPKMKPDKHYTIPEGVKTILAGAFRECTCLEQVDFPDSLEYIGEGAFHGCSSMKSIYVPDEVVIERNAYYFQGNTFRDCTSLKSASVPELVEYMFSGCSTLKNVIIRTKEDSKEYVWPEGVFLNCFNLESIEFYGENSRRILLPTGLEEVGERIFYGYDFPKDGINTADAVETEPDSTKLKSLQEVASFEYVDKENPYIDIGFGHEEIFLIHQDGSVTMMFENAEDLKSKAFMKNEVESWTDIKKITGCMFHSIVGLKNDGSLLFTTDNSYTNEEAIQLSQITKWNGIESVYTDYNILVGLSSDGSVTALGGHGSYDLSDWNDIVDIAVHIWISEYSTHLVGVTIDGKLKEVNAPLSGYVSICGYDPWLGTVEGHAVSVQNTAEPYGGFIILNEDGTVAVTDQFEDIAYELSQWKDIVQIESCAVEGDVEGDSYAAVGLRKDGTVVTTGGLFPETKEWKSVKQLVLPGPWSSILYAVDETGHVLECGSMVTHEAWENIDKLYCVRDKGIVGITNDGRVLSDIELF